MENDWFHLNSQATTWARWVVCLANPEQRVRPNRAAKEKLKQSGLGRKKITFNATTSAADLTAKLKEVYPKLESSGGFDVMTQGNESQASELLLIEQPPTGYNVQFLSQHFKTGIVYIRPRQVLAMDDSCEVSSQNMH